MLQLHLFLAVVGDQVDPWPEDALIEARPFVDSFPHRNGQAVGGRNGAVEVGHFAIERLTFLLVELVDLAANERSETTVQQPRLEAEVGACRGPAVENLR